MDLTSIPRVVELGTIEGLKITPQANFNLFRESHNFIVKIELPEDITINLENLEIPENLELIFIQFLSHRGAVRNYCVHQHLTELKPKNRDEASFGLKCQPEEIRPSLGNEIGINYEENLIYNGWNMIYRFK